MPAQVADLALGAAAGWADALYLEPDGNGYALRLERDHAEVASVRLDAPLGRAAIARLALVGDLDLAAGRTASAVVRVRAAGRDRDVVVTIRHGDALRADLMVLPARGVSRGMPPSAEPLAGDAIGRYQVVRRLGAGGMGTVFRVRHRTLEREYALKVLHYASHGDDEADQQFLREARLASRIRHPNIVDVLDYGHLPNGRPYLVMELLEGESLEDLSTQGPVPAADVVDVARQLASALAAAHARGVIHADVTPSNVLVASTQPLAVKLVDFGLAFPCGEAPEHSADGTIVGTPHYISPEQLRGLPASEQSDQYALGAVLFQLLTGAPPYDHTELRELALMHLGAPIPPVHSPLGELPEQLADLVTRCLQKSPKHRFPNMRALIAALDEVALIAQRSDWTRWLER